MPPKKAASKKDTAAAAVAPAVAEASSPPAVVAAASPKKVAATTPSPVKAVASPKKKPAAKKAAPAKPKATAKEDKPKAVKKAAPKKKVAEDAAASSGAESASPQKKTKKTPAATSGNESSSSPAKKAIATAEPATAASPAKKKPAAKKRTKSQAEENGTSSTAEGASPVKKAKAAPKAKAAAAAVAKSPAKPAKKTKAPAKSPAKKDSGAESSAAEGAGSPKKKKATAVKKKADTEEGAAATAPKKSKKKVAADKESTEAPAEKEKKVAKPRVRKPKPVPVEDDTPVVGQRKGFTVIPTAMPKLLKKTITPRNRSKATTSGANEADEGAGSAASGGEEGDEEDVEPSKPVKSSKKDKKLLNATDTDWENQQFQIMHKFKLKIASWNVSGLRAWLEKGGKKYLLHEHPDIVCLQETKCKPEAIPEEAAFPGYHPYWLGFSGQAGVGIYSRQMPLNVTYGLGDKEMDEEGRLLTAEYEKFFLVNVYVPNSGRKLVTLPKRLRWNMLFKEYVQGLDRKKAVIICGDMNVAHEEIDLANPKSNKKNAGFTQEERDGMTDFLDSCDFVDTFRHFYPKLKDQYTFWTYMSNARAKNVGWRLDYILVSRRIIDKVVDNSIRDKVYGSDHCPIVGFFNL